MGDSKIQWTGKTWNPLRARNKATDERGWFCEHVSEGCRNCYAEKMNINTYFGNGLPYKPSSLDGLDLFLDEKILQQPLHWRKPQQIFPCSMTDLFGRWVTDEWLLKIFDVMRRCPQHTFQVLTKRADRMRDFCQRLRFNGGEGSGRMWLAESAEAGGYRLMGSNGATGMPWVWCGVSVEDQKTADERIPSLLATPTSVRWISAEPLLDRIDLTRVEFCKDTRQSALTPTYMGLPTRQAAKVAWVVVGGESGKDARSMDLAWARSLVAQCRAAEVPVFVKQLGHRPWWNGIGSPPPDHIYLEPCYMDEQSGWRFDLMRDKKGGDISEFPQDLRVREFPDARRMETH